MLNLNLNMMKKIFNLLFLTLFLINAGWSQNSLVSIGGTVMDELTGIAISNKLVTASVSSGGMITTLEMHTDDSGYFMDTVSTFPQGIVDVTVIDCNGDPQMQSQAFSPDNYSLFFDFIICADSTPNGCDAYYSYSVPPAGGTTVSFTDLSTGNPTSWFWDFGDGTTSTEQNPVHTFNAMTTYNVCLTVSSGDSTCYDTFCSDVNLTPGGDCEALFDFETWNNIDFTFYGQSMPFPADTYFWDFGDGSTGIGEVIDHTYSISDMVIVTLTTYTFDPATGDTCVASFEMPVEVGGSAGECQNWFTPYTMDFITFSFEAGSFPEASAYLWDFGDGTAGEGQMVEHTYSDSIPMDYIVTLTTYHTVGGAADTCVAVSEQIITVGNGGPDCENFFWYEQYGYAFNFHGESFPLPADQYYWDFGDGTTGEGQSVNHIYEAGMGDVFTVTLTTVGLSPAGDSCVATSTQQVFVNGGGMDCDNWFWYETYDNQIFTFFGESFPIPADVYMWDFGDGTTGSGQAIDHIFDTTLADQFEVTLTTLIFNPATGDSCMAQSSQMVYTGGNNQECENMFWYMNTGEFTYEFMGESMPFPADEFYWEFGDGTTATGPAVAHTFDPSLGDAFNVCLTTLSWDPMADSCTATSCQELVLGGQSGEQLFGHILADGSPVDYALVGLFTMGPGGTFTYDFTTTEPGSGSYFFNNVSAGEYYIFASLTPQSPLFYDYFQTYYGDAIFWFDATLINSGSLTNPYDINLVPITSFTAGPGTISGTVTMEENKGPGDNIMVMLMDADQDPLGFVQTNETGAFEFDDLGYGTYHLTVEMPGVNSEVATVEISEDNQEAALSFYVKGTSAWLGVGQVSAITTTGKVFPNPATDQVSLELVLTQQTDLNINILNQMGQVVNSSQRTLSTGKQILSVPVEKLSSGMYHLQLIENNGQVTMKRFIK